jgi:hypothetical protein
LPITLVENEQNTEEAKPQCSSLHF